MQSSMVVAGMDALSESCENILTRRANQRHNCIVPQLQNARGPARQRAPLARLQAKNPYPQLKLHRPQRRVASRVAEPRACHARARGDIDVNPAPDLDKATAPAATGQTKAAAAPRIKLLSHRYAIDHPDPELGEQLMADALGVADRDAMQGILRQLVKASVKDERPDEAGREVRIRSVGDASKAAAPKRRGRRRAIRASYGWQAICFAQTSMSAEAETDLRNADVSQRKIVPLAQ
jgi:hypothetical protein